MRLPPRDANGRFRRRKRRNPDGAGYKSGGVFHPVRAWAGYDPSRVGEGGRKATTTQHRPKQGTPEERSTRARDLLAMRRFRAAYRALETVRNEHHSRRGKAMSHGYQQRLRAAEATYEPTFDAAFAAWKRTHTGTRIDFARDPAIRRLIGQA